MTPGELHDHVGVQQIVTLEKHRAEASVILAVEEPEKEFFRHFRDLRLGGVFHGVLVEAILLAELDRLLPPIVAFVQVGRNAAELDELVFLEPLCQRNVIKVVECIDGRSKALIIFFLD